MNFLRSSPFSFFSVACLLQALMRFCCAFCAALGSAPESPFRQELMKLLRASPFLSAAFSLQSFMRDCCFFWAAVGSFLSCAHTLEAAKTRHKVAMASFIGLPPEDVRWH